MGQRRFYPELESLRGLAALAVSLCHILRAAPPQHAAIADYSSGDWAHMILTSLSSSEGGVAIFFVLSGYVLSSGLDLSGGLTPRVYVAFAVRRLFRLMPAIWVFIVLTALVLGSDAREAAQESVLIGPFIVNPPLWTLSVEMTICVYFPLLVAANVVLAPPFRWALFAILLWLSQVDGLPFIHIYLFMFQAGIMIPLVSASIDRVHRWAAAAMLVIAIAAVMVPLNLSLHGVLTTPQEAAIEGLGAFYVVGYAHARRSPLRALLHHPFCRFLGRVSYSMYLCNWLVVRMLARSMLGAHFSLGRALLAIAVGIPAIIVIAWGGWRLVEEPTHRLGRALSARILGTHVKRAEEGEIPGLAVPIVRSAAPR